VIPLRRALKNPPPPEPDGCALDVAILGVLLAAAIFLLNHAR
jgi:hypothetical protein